MSLINAGTRGFTNGDTARVRGIRVKLPAGVLELAGLDDLEIGTIDIPVAANQANSGVILRNVSGSRHFVASGAISAGNPFYSAANGKVSGSQATGAYKIGIALTSASTDGDLFEGMYLSGYGIPKSE